MLYIYMLHMCYILNIYCIYICIINMLNDIYTTNIYLGKKLKVHSTSKDRQSSPIKAHYLQSTYIKMP